MPALNGGLGLLLPIVGAVPGNPERQVQLVHVQDVAVPVLVTVDAHLIPGGLQHLPLRRNDGSQGGFSELAEACILHVQPDATGRFPAFQHGHNRLRLSGGRSCRFGVHIAVYAHRDALLCAARVVALKGFLNGVVLLCDFQDGEFYAILFYFLPVNYALPLGAVDSEICHLTPPPADPSD